MFASPPVGVRLSNYLNYIASAERKIIRVLRNVDGWNLLWAMLRCCGLPVRVRCSSKSLGLAL